jgi:hypothetical protein
MDRLHEHKPSSFDPPAMDIAEPSTSNADPSHLVADGQAHKHDSGVQHFMEESTGAVESGLKTTSAHALSHTPPEHHIPTTAESSSVYSLQPDPIITGESPILSEEFPSQATEDDEEWLDEAPPDIDSAYDGDSLREDDTETLPSFITDYRWENGRRYHAYSDGAYWVRLRMQSTVTILSWSVILGPER